MNDWQLERFTGKDIVFIGAGKGRAMAGLQMFLERHGHIRSFKGVDKQPASADPLGFLQDYDPTTTCFIKNEAIPGHEVAVPYETPMQIFFELVKRSGATIIGITGTKGKSTTAALTAHALQSAGRSVVLAGNIGRSPFEFIDAATQETLFVLELSSYQLDDLHASPHISACLNLYNDHVDWHGSQAAYWEAKHNIMRYAGPTDSFVYNPQFSALRAWASQADCQTIAIDPSATLDLSSSALFGDHNRLNGLIAQAICRLCGLSNGQFQAALDSFTPLEHRMQVVEVKHGRTYIDDAIGMTPESTLASLRAITAKYGPVGCLLLGGQNRSYDFSEVFAYIAQLQIPNLVLFPDTIQAMRAALPDGYQPEIFETRDMVAAVTFAAEHAPDQSVVLLSTAAPSYSIWKDFEDKGDQFQQAVARLVD